MEVKEKKTFLLNTKEELFNRFKYLCEEEGFNPTTALNQMMKVAVKKNKLWQYIKIKRGFLQTQVYQQVTRV